MPSTPRRNGWQWTDTVLADTTSESLLMPEENDLVASVGVMPGAGGTCLIEYTLSSLKTVKDLPGAVIWRPWPIGVTAINASDLVDGPVTALRMKAMTADAGWEVIT